MEEGCFSVLCYSLLRTPCIRCRRKLEKHVVMTQAATSSLDKGMTKLDFLERMCAIRAQEKIGDVEDEK